MATEPIEPRLEATALDQSTEASTAALYRAAIGPVGEAHYLPRFLRFEELDRVGIQWNTAAALTSLNWFIFRQLWLPALTYVGSVIGLTLLVFGIGRLVFQFSEATEMAALGLLATLAFVLPGLFGTALFYKECRKRMAAALAANATVPEACAALTKQASSRKRAVVIAVTNALLLGLLAATYFNAPKPGKLLDEMHASAVSGGKLAPASAPASAATPAASSPAAPASSPASAAPAASAPASAASAPAAPASTAAVPSSRAVAGVVQADSKRSEPPSQPASAPSVAASVAASVPTSGATTAAKPAPSAPVTKPSIAPASATASAPKAKTSAASAPVSAPVPVPAVAASKPANKPTPKAVVATPASAPAPATTPTLAAGYYINVGLFAEESNAKNAHTKLLDAGLTAFVQELKTPKGKRMRVRVGPFDSEAQAESAATKIRGLQLEAVVFQQ